MTETIACYVRVSTADQNLERQLESTHDYAQDSLGADLDAIETYRDKSTGTSTERSGYRQLMADVEAGEVDVVVVHELTRMSRSLQDLERTVERVTESGAELHFVRDALSFGPIEDDEEPDPMKKLQMQMLGAFAEWQARVKQMNTKEGITARQNEDDYHHGRAPLGFEKDDGTLLEGENYDQICAVLDMVAKDELSKRQAAKELDTSRPTINRALDRPDLYGL
jgi:DNA invertase Pin-like site-specific DNA recombinase